MNSHSISLLVSSILAGDILLVAILFHVLPNITRRDIFFAVTVNPAFRPTAEARTIIRRFRTAMWVHSGIALAIVYILLAFGKPLVAPVGIFWQMAFILHAYLHARKQTLPHAAAPSTHREAVLAPRRAGGFGFALLQIGPFAILAASAIYIHTIWYRIPERFPIHWGLDGRPNGWATRSFMGVYGPWLIGLAVCLFMELLAYSTVHWTRQIHATGAEAQHDAHARRVQVGVLLALEYFFALVFNGIPFTALGPHPERAPNIAPLLVGTFAFIAVIFAILIHTGQGGANLSRAESDIIEQRRPVGDRTPDQCWRAGMFYVNPNDPALLVEKRFGIGYTFNFGRPAAWVFVALILALLTFPLVIAFVSTSSH